MSSPLGSTATRGRNAGIGSWWRSCCRPCWRSRSWQPWTTGGSTGPRAVVGLRLGYVLLIAGLAGLTWAESVNKFFEPTVRIQTDRGHRVIDTGPYAIVRHPGYVAAFLFFTGHAPGPGLLVGFDPRRPVVPALGRANDLGGPNSAGRVGGLRGIRTASPIQAGSWRVVDHPCDQPCSSDVWFTTQLPAPACTPTRSCTVDPARRRTGRTELSAAPRP